MENLLLPSFLLGIQQGQLVVALEPKTVVQMIAIPFLLYHGQLFKFIDTQLWGTVLIIVSAVLTIWSMVYYLQKALPEIRARVR